MGKEKLITDREACESVATAWISSGAAVASTMLALQPSTIAAMAIVLPILGLTVGRGAHQIMTQRLPAFAKGYLRGSDPDPSKAQEKVNQQAVEENPNQSDTMFRSFRLMMDAVDESAIEAIGVLAAQYNNTKSRPDAYFRALGRLLCELEPGELDTLVSTMNGIQTILTGMSVSPDSVDLALTEDGMLEVFADEASRTLGNTYEYLLSGPRMFALLIREGLASNSRVITFGQQRPRFAIDTEIIRRILATIAPAIDDTSDETVPDPFPD